MKNNSTSPLTRTIDITLAAIALIVCLPLFPIIEFIIKACCSGPTFFKERRTGMGGVQYYALRFRTTHMPSRPGEGYRPFAFGNFLRSTGIDRLPQLFNILFGNTSFFIHH